MNIHEIKDSLVSILKSDAILSSYTRGFTDKYVERPYITGSEVVIEVLSGNITQNARQPFGYNRYELPIIIRIHQRNAKMSDSEDTLETILSRLLMVLDNNRKKITGVNGISNITLFKDLNSTEVDTRVTEVNLVLDVLEER